MKESSNQLITDVSKMQLSKHEEEICGDRILITSTDDYTVIVLSDGLGSGVKANILSTMTVKMAGTMLINGSSVDEVMETMAETLPVCQERKLAYSTLTIIQIFNDGQLYLAEYDNPPVFIGRGREGLKIPRSRRTIGDRTVKEARFKARPGDWLVLVSDGVLHAGIGGRWNLGWGWERVEKYLKNSLGSRTTAQGAAEELGSVVKKLYGGCPGDDASMVVIRLKKPSHLAVMVGPPENKRDDSPVVKKLMKLPGEKVVCGGTTGNIAARELNKDIEVDLHSDREGIPPTASIEGIDLVTEGMLTISQVLKNFRSDPDPEKYRNKKDGASRLTHLLLKADLINFLIGRAINPAHQEEDIPKELALKLQIMDDLIDELKALGKEVEAEFY